MMLMEARPHSAALTSVICSHMFFLPLVIQCQLTIFDFPRCGELKIWSLSQWIPNGMDTSTEVTAT